jgi:hexosaminidase
MYDAWSPNVFVDGSTLPAGERARNLGSLLHVWCDDPGARTEDELAGAIFPRLRVLAQHTWGSAKIAPIYLLFRRMIKAVGPAPD